jgi:acyl-CoA synthetase (AMP-forming)/AMP-acid ligase II
MQDHFLQQLRTRFAQRAGQTAFIYREWSYSYSDVEAQARRWASSLQTLGVEPGDRIALFTPDKLSFLMAHLGTLFAGTVSLPLNPRFTR